MQAFRIGGMMPSSSSFSAGSFSSNQPAGSFSSAPPSGSSSATAAAASAPTMPLGGEMASLDEDKNDSATIKKLSAAKRSAILSQLDDCMDCNNKAKRECPHKRCKTCCARFIAMANKVCEAHAASRDAKESLVGRHLMGIVDGSFENGHFITCVIEDMTYKGIIFTNTCAVKVWRVPKPPDLHITPTSSSVMPATSSSSMSGAHMSVSSPDQHMQGQQMQSQLNSIGSGTSLSSPQQSAASLISCVTTNPVVGMVTAAASSSGKRKYVKSGRYAKRAKTASTSTGLPSSGSPGNFRMMGSSGVPETPSRTDNASGEMFENRAFFDDEEDLEDEIRQQNMPERFARQMAAFRRGYPGVVPPPPPGKKQAKVRKGPRRPQTNYTFFVAEQRPIFMNQNPDASFKDIAGLVAAKWRSLTDEEKKPYNEKAAKDRVRFEHEKALLERAKEHLVAPPSAARTPQSGSVSGAGPANSSSSSSAAGGSGGPSINGSEVSGQGDVVMIDNRAFRQPSLPGGPHSNESSQ